MTATAVILIVYLYCYHTSVQDSIKILQYSVASTCDIVRLPHSPHIQKCCYHCKHRDNYEGAGKGKPASTGSILVCFLWKTVNLGGSRSIAH